MVCCEAMLRLKAWVGLFPQGVHVAQRTDSDSPELPGRDIIAPCLSQRPLPRQPKKH